MFIYNFLAGTLEESIDYESQITSLESSGLPVENRPENAAGTAFSSKSFAPGSCVFLRTNQRCSASSAKKKAASYSYAVCARRI